MSSWPTDRWCAFLERRCPAGLPEAVTDPSLGKLHAFATVVLTKFSRGERLQGGELGFLHLCHEQLDAAVPALTGEAHGHFAELNTLVAAALDAAATDLARFGDVTGWEMGRVLTRRVGERLAGQTDRDRFTAMVSASLVVQMNILRGPIEQASDRGQAADELVAMCGRLLRSLLQPLVAAGGGRPAEPDSVPSSGDS